MKESGKEDRKRQWLITRCPKSIKTEILEKYYTKRREILNFFELKNFIIKWMLERFQPKYKITERNATATFDAIIKSESENENNNGR